MSDLFAQRWPNIDRFVFERGWIEIGPDDFSDSFVRALDPGGLVWEGAQFYDTLEDALTDLEQGLSQWMKDAGGSHDER